ncbi:TetR family transcriptional regulator [Winogradskya humida]|uniref:TetR family transcriptional regulator n=2 Tax=Winogradskya humida TaxID=113566 RepID=A0ABQ3ZHF0_9ACTN|nr:TetR family transcriptional regulator [Actinoplanes humidus]
MEDIAAAAPVSKRTLYAHFPAKEDLVLAQLNYLLNTGQTMLDALQRTDVPPRDRILAMFTTQPWPDGIVHGCPFLQAATEHPDPASPVHAFARDKKRLMLTLVTALVTDLGIANPEPLAEQLVTLSDGATTRAMVLNDPTYGRHARAAAELLLNHAPQT